MEVFSPGYLSDRHGAEDVEEDEGTVGKVLPQKVTMGQALDVGDGGEGQFGHNPSVKAKSNRKIKRCYKPDRKPEPVPNQREFNSLEFHFHCLLSLMLY